jgi:hypothetical protein
MSVAQKLARLLGRDGPGAKLLEGRLREQQFDHLIGARFGVANLADGRPAGRRRGARTAQPSGGCRHAGRSREWVAERMERRSAGPDRRLPVGYCYPELVCPA